MKPSMTVENGAPEFARALDQVGESFGSIPPHLHAAALTALYALFLSWCEHIRPQVGEHVNRTITPLMRKVWRQSMGAGDAS